MKNTITLYGAPWCGDCKRSMGYLNEHNIPFDYINIDEVEEAAEKVKEINQGFASIPTIIFPDGQILVEPTDSELAETIAVNKEALHLSS